MSDLELRRAVRALTSAPHAIPDDMLNRIAKTCEEEAVRRSLERETLLAIFRLVNKLSPGASGRIHSAWSSSKGASPERPVALTLEALMWSTPNALLCMGGIGEVTIVALYLSLLMSKVVLPAWWSVPPAWTLHVAWRQAQEAKRAGKLTLVNLCPDDHRQFLINRTLNYRLARLVGEDHWGRPLSETADVVEVEPGLQQVVERTEEVS